ncbi:hypothetical protein V6N13_053770 [Hibiscus sabdariffa]
MVSEVATLQLGAKAIDVGGLLKPFDQIHVILVPRHGIVMVVELALVGFEAKIAFGVSGVLIVVSCCMWWKYRVVCA